MPKIQLTLVTFEVIFSVNVPVNEHSHCKYSTGVCLFCLYSVLIGSVVYWYMVFLLTLIIVQLAFDYHDAAKPPFLPLYA